MIKIFRLLFESFLSEFKWYRKRKGDKWYYIVDHSTNGGIEGSLRGWTQNPGKENEVLKEEDHSRK